MQGFIVNDTTVTGITTAFDVTKGILLKFDASTDPKSKPVPQSCYYSHVVVTLDVTAGLPATIQAMLTWDVAGDDLMAGPTELITLQSGLTTATRRMFGAAVNAWPSATSDQTTLSSVYLFLAVDAGTVDLVKAELFWSKG